MRVLFVGGGTGGHINPALAAMRYLKLREPDAEMLYVGGKGGMEERLVPAAGYAMRTITISGFQRRLTPKNILRNVQTVSRLFSSSREARKIIRTFQPDLCFGTGGYVSGPVIREAAKMGIPCVMHESNAFPGITTKMLAKHVQAVLLAVTDAKKYFGKSANCVITGNPVRGEILEANREDARRELGLDDRPMVLSFGGSLGARAINSAVAEMLCSSAKEKKYQHIHAYGNHDPDFLNRLVQMGFRQKDNPQIELRSYIDNMATCLAAADLVIGRAGAMTVTEIEAAGKASILIPSPNVAENHQYHNAMALVRQNAAELIEEQNLSGAVLWEKTDSLLANPERMKTLEKNAAKMEIADASARIYREMKRAAARGRQTISAGK